MKFPPHPRNAFALAAVALATVGAPALAQTFTAQEGAITGAAPNLVNADRISFNYAGVINQTLVGSSFDGNDPFTESGFLTKASFANGGSAVPSQLNGVSPAGYGIYGVFSATGTATAFGGGILANFSTLNLTLWADPGQDTTLTFVGGVATRGGTLGDDGILATYTLQTGQAHVFGGLANGDFDTILNMTRTSLGNSFFVAPNPFYTLENFGGNTQTITGASLTESFTATATGAGTELFIAQVPEPETYALMLAGLGVIGWVARRRKV
jgi:hypothetical protein